jgi:hypothetical protein
MSEEKKPLRKWRSRMTSSAQTLDLSFGKIVSDPGYRIEERYNEYIITNQSAAD